MTFKEELLGDIATVRRDANRKRRQALPDNEWWEEVREAEIQPVLADVEEALNQDGIGGEEKKKNGGSGITLLAARPELARHLTFTHMTGKIKVTSSEASIEEIWDDRNHVTAENVAAKARAFVRLVAAAVNLDGPRSIYEHRGILSF